MLWNSVFEFFVKFVFGGVLYSSIEGVLEYKGILGLFYVSDYQIGLDTADNLNINIFSTYSMPLGNYLSMIATIITMVIIVTLCALFIWKIVKLVGGLIR